MATSDETNVTIDSIIVVSPSTRNSTGTSRLLIVSHRPTFVIASGSAEKSAPQETRNASAMPATTGTWELDRSQRAPSAAMSAPKSGKHGIIQTFCCCTKKPDKSPLLYFRRSSHGCTGWAGSMPAGVRMGYDSGPGTGSIGSASDASWAGDAAGTPSSLMSCQSVTSSEERRL